MSKINKKTLDEEYECVDKEIFWQAHKKIGNSKADFKVLGFWDKKGDFFNKYYVSWDLLIRLKIKNARPSEVVPPPTIKRRKLKGDKKDE